MLIGNNCTVQDMYKEVKIGLNVLKILNLPVFSIDKTWLRQVFFILSFSELMEFKFIINSLMIYDWGLAQRSNFNSSKMALHDSGKCWALLKFIAAIYSVKILSCSVELMNVANVHMWECFSVV